MLFVAVCAYLGARLFTVVSIGDSLVLISETVYESVCFEGIALRDEIPLGVSPDKVNCSDGERICAGYELTSEAISPASAIYLEKCDGLEYLSPPEGIITADIVQKLLEAKPHTPSKGRLVTGKFWYCAVIADRELPEGKRRIRFEPYDEPVTGFVSKGEGDAYIIRLAIGEKKYLSERKVSGEIIIKEYTALAVPNSAVYEKDGRAYVCIQTPAGDREVETEVLYRIEGKALLKSSESLREGLTIRTEHKQRNSDGYRKEFSSRAAEHENSGGACRA